MKKLILVVLISFINFFVFAQKETVELGTIVVTPYRTEESNLYLQNNLVLLKSQDLEKSYTFGLSDAFNLINGLNLVGGGKFSSSSEAIFLRGAQPRHTGYFLEGIKLYDPSNPSSYYVPADFSLAGLDRIEIVKTALSTIYGSNPIGGAVNFIVKKPQEKPYIMTKIKAGSFKTNEEEIELGGKLNSISYLLDISRLDTEGFSKAKEKNNNPEEDSYQNTNFLLSVDYQPSDTLNIGLIAKAVYARTELDDDDNYDGLPEDDLDNLSWNNEAITGLYIKQKLNEIFAYKIQGGYTDIYRKTKDDTEEYVRDWYRGKTSQFLSSLEITPLNFYKAILGFDYTNEKVESYGNYSGWITSMRETNNLYGFFIENIFKFFEDNLIVDNSFRREQNPLFGHHHTRKGGLTYKIPKINTKLYFSYSEGFKAPSIYQLYSSSGNRNLKPEESKSWEIGISQPIKENFEFKATYFHTDFKNLIDFIYINPATYQGRYENANKAKSRGLELELNYKPTDSLKFRSGYTYLVGRQDFVDGDIVNWSLVSYDIFNHSPIRIPKHKVFFDINCKIDKFDFSFDISYIGKRIDRIWKTVGLDTFDEFPQMKSYILSNIKLTYNATNNVSIFLDLNNILNQDYERIKGYQEEKFSVYAGLKLKF